MSWLSNLWDGAKSVVKTVAKVALPVISAAAGAIPVIGGVASKVVDTLGNKLVDGIDGSPPELAAAQSVNSYVDAAVANNDNATLSKPSVDVSHEAVTADVENATESSFLGIGGSSPGILGIGTGKNKARKAAEQQAKASGKTPGEVKAAGDAAADAVKDASKSGGAGDATIAIGAFAVGLLFLLL